MSHWDSSALIKLYVQEFESAAFRGLAANATRVVTASRSRHEIRTVFQRREAEGVLLSGEAATLYSELHADIAAADVLIQPETVDVEREFGVVLQKCFSQAPATFIRTNDALHLASAQVAREPEFVTVMYANVLLRYSWDSRCCPDGRDGRVSVAFTDPALGPRVGVES